jgi:hypothetical protein
MHPVEIREATRNRRRLTRTHQGHPTGPDQIAICGDHAADVKCWQDGQMVLRWIAASMSEARSSTTA